MPMMWPSGCMSPKIGSGITLAGAHPSCRRSGSLTGLPVQFYCSSRQHKVNEFVMKSIRRQSLVEATEQEEHGDIQQKPRTFEAN